MQLVRAKVKLANAKVIALVNALMTLARWLKPGSPAFFLGIAVDTLMPTARRVQETQEEMMNEAARRYPPDHPKAGARMEETGDDGIRRIVFKSDEVQADYAKRLAEFLEAEQEYDLPIISVALLDAMERDRLDKPKSNADGSNPDGQLDYSALAPLLRLSEPSNA